MTKRHARLGTMFALTTCMAAMGCQADDTAEGGRGREGTPTVTTSDAALRVSAIRSRFQVSAVDVRAISSHAGSAQAVLEPSLRTRQPVIAPATDMHLGASPLGSSHLRARVATDGIARPANVDLPRRATDAVVLEDATSHVRVGFALQGAKAAEATEAGGYALYPGAAGGADVVHRVHGEGTEDYVVFETKPSSSSLAYDVDVSTVAGLRLVGETLEFLASDGSPALRVAPPWVVDASGTRHAASLAVEGCAYDTSAAAPWGRAVVAPGAEHCTVRVAWGEVAYPAVVDPSWTTTGSMQSRYMQSSTVLASGKVLVSGGYDMATWDIRSSAEIYNPATGTFAATGSMTTKSIGHTMTLLASGQVLVVGADPDYGMGSAPLNRAQIFNEGTGQFTNISSMSAGRRFATATRLSNNKVLVVGGRIFGWGPEVELFDPATNTFATVTSPGIGSDEGSHTATLLSSGKVLVTSGTALNAYLYDAGTNAFSATGAQKQTRNDAGSVRLASGKVLVFGGYDSSGNYRYSAETYDPSTGAFTLTGSMLYSQTGAEAVVLPSGTVLLVGYGNDTQLFNPTTSSFSNGLANIYGHYNPVAHLLSTGKVLVSGGDAWGGSATSSSELYTP